MLTWILAVQLAEAKKKPKTPPPPPQGWAREEGMRGDCYYPPVYDKLLEADRRLARQNTLEAIKLQWSGGRDDGVSFDPYVVEDVEVTLLGRPAQIEVIGAQNLEQCKTAMKGGGTDAWASWLGGLRSKLTAGECLQPLTYTLYDYLDINRGWQRPVVLCKGDRAKIWATTADRFRITDNGPWINITGNGEQARGMDYPCFNEGCFVGMLIGKFTTDAGVETVFPIGAGVTFEAPENGVVSWTINDTTWFDNTWFKGSLQDHTAVTIEPAE